MNFTTSPITREQFLKAEWQVDKNTEYYSDNNSYNQLMVVVDANTGGIVRKESHDNA